MSPSDHEDENDPDGIYAFRRKRNCSYYAVSINLNALINGYCILHFAFDIESNKLWILKRIMLEVGHNYQGIKN